MSLTFKPATKEQAKARIALAGPSGSGKTYTSLTLASALGEKVALIDTERGSASKYAGGTEGFTFDTLQLQSFEPLTLVKALAAAGAAGYDAVVVDSLSHFWMGTGGMLEQVDNAAKRNYGGNSFGGWKDARPMERQMIDALVAYPGHVIATMRTKTEWVIETNDKGKNTPRRIGIKPEQRDGIEYEFDIVGDLDLDNTLVVSKSRCISLAGAVIRKPGLPLAEHIQTWLSDGAAVRPVAEYVDEALSDAATRESLLALLDEVNSRGLAGAPVLDCEGEATTLAALIIAQGQALRAEAAS